MLCFITCGVCHLQVQVPLCDNNLISLPIVEQIQGKMFITMLRHGAGPSPESVCLVQISFCLPAPRFLQLLLLPSRRRLLPVRRLVVCAWFVKVCVATNDRQRVVVHKTVGLLLAVYSLPCCMEVD